MPARWSPPDDVRLSEWYAEGVSVIEIGRRLGRSPDGVGARRRALGLPARRPRRRRWSPSQDALLCASAEAGVPARAIAAHLGLPLEAARRRRRELVPRRPPGRPYEAREDAALGEAIHGGRSLRELGAQLGRSEGALRTRARSLGLIATATRRRWTRRDDQLLQEGYERGLTCHSVALGMLGGKRTPAAVSARARKLGLVTYARAWTAEDDAALRRLARAGASLYAAAERLGRTPEAIRRRAGKLDVELARDAAPAAGRPWKPEDVAILRDFAGLDPGRLSRLLGRSDRAVLRRMRALGLANRTPHRLPPSRAGFTSGELRLIAREGADGGPRRVLALSRRLGRSPGELHRAARGLPGAAASSSRPQARHKAR